MKQLLGDKPLAYGLAALLLGQVLYLFGFAALFAVALVYVLAVGLPYPRVFRSFVARVVIGILAAFSVIQIASLIQFFVFGETDFRMLSFLALLVALGTVLGLYNRIPREPLVLWERKDLAAGLCALFFVVPLTGLLFWKGDPVNIITFTAIQVPDGVNHYMAMTEMSNAQHLTYRTVEYYPKGFHISSGFFMDAFHMTQRDLSWVGNARVFVVQYIIWGALLAYLVFYLARQLLASFIDKQRFRLPDFLLALTLGVVLSPLYLLPFTYQGFINYYYITSVVVAGALLLFSFDLRDKKAWWPLTAYLALVLGISMSWTILLPALLLPPLLYLLTGNETLVSLARRFRQPAYWWAIGFVVLHLVTVYLHLRYSSLTPEQGLNAIGNLRDFHFGVLLAGLALVAYFGFSNQFNEQVRRFAANVLLPFYLLDGALMLYQYMTVEELRYYSIKIALLMEILILAVAAALVVYTLLRSNMNDLRRWLFAPLMLGMAFVLLIALTANPFKDARKMTHNYIGTGGPAFYQSNIELFAKLGMQGKLEGTNNTTLHHDPASNKFYGNALIPNWANLMQYVPDGDAQAADCTNKIFNTLAYGVGEPEEQDVLIPAVQKCIERALVRDKPYFIITDEASVPALKETFGEQVTYVY